MSLASCTALTKTEQILLLLFMDTEYHFDQSNTKPQESLYWEANAQNCTFNFEFLIFLEGNRWMLGLTTAAVFVKQFYYSQKLEFFVETMIQKTFFNFTKDTAKTSPTSTIQNSWKKM